MKKSKNILLLIGSSMVAMIFLLVIHHAATVYYGLLEFRRPGAFRVLLKSEILPAALKLALQGFSVALIVQNLQKKTGKALPVACIVINAAVLLYVLLTLFLGSLPSLLIQINMGLLSTNLVRRLIGTIALHIVAYGLLIAGSILSLPRKTAPNHQALSEYDATV